MKSETTGLKHIIDAAGYSLTGFKAAWKNEEAVRQEVCIFSVLFIVAFWWGGSMIETVFLISCCLIVFMAEIFNSALETVVDRIGSEYHELSGRAKDMASAAVYVAWGNMVMVWVVIGINRFLFTV